jgi:hypothetical protein
VLSLELLSIGLRGEIIYDNSENNLGAFLTRKEEFGDEVHFAGSARMITSVSFEIVGERFLPQDARVRFRLYNNDGPLPPPPEPQFAPPGELIYQSDPIPIHGGVQPIEIRDLAVPVLNNATWTVEFLAMGEAAGERAGVQLYHPPIIGRSFRDYWVREPAGFRLYILDSLTPASFAARFEASPDPPVEITATPGAAGETTLQITGPIGTEQLIEVSADGVTWRPLATVNFATNSVASYVDTGIPPNETRRYRTRASPYPGETVILQRIAREPGGATTLTLFGPLASEHVLEATADYQRWIPLSLIRFTERQIVHTDASGVGQRTRIYRTRPAADVGQFYVIRGITRRPDGAIVLRCSGRPSLRPVTVEATENLSDWTSIGTLRFDQANAEYVDPVPANVSRRFYRLQF